MIYLIIIGIGFVLCFVVSVKIDNTNRKKEIEERNATMDKKMEVINKRIERLNMLDAELDDKYGKCTWCVPYREDSLDGNLRIYNDQEIIILDHKKIIHYKDLRSCEVINDNINFNSTNSQTVTKTDTKDMLKRSVVGGVIAGPAGAIIGGVTAKKTTKTDKNLLSLPSLNIFYIKIEFVNSDTPYIMSCGREMSRARRINTPINKIINEGYFDPIND